MSNPDQSPAIATDPFQARVRPWLLACFGEAIAADREERNHRFLEESLELVQACGCTASEAHQLVDYVYGRPVGEPAQEVGGVMVTLAALCLANTLEMHDAAEVELARIWTKVEKIRAKQAAKPKHSPLPVAPTEAAAMAATVPAEPIALDHIACIEDGELRFMSGRKAPAYDCELYAMPDGKNAPPLFAQAPVAGQPAEPSPADDGGTPGPWFVRTREKNGKVLGCFVAAPDCQGMAYDAEILGDDEYRDTDEDEDAGIKRRLADCHLIVAAVNAHRLAPKGDSNG